jgi:hypothetical protein
MLNDNIVAAAGISPDDLVVTLYETPVRIFPSAEAWPSAPIFQSLDPRTADRWRHHALD